MDVMKRLAFLVISSCALVAAADLSGVRNVYVMPMARGLDQYLAGRLTSHGVFQVVTDPKLADAVLTDRVGDVLSSQLEALFPTPKPETEDEDETEPAAKPDPKAEKTEKPAKTAKDLQDSPLAAFSATSNKADNVAPTSTFGRSKGNIFLVDSKSRQVLWSTYDPPKSNAARDLNRTASDIVSRIKKDLAPKKK
jgi:hypothetical protein